MTKPRSNRVTPTIPVRRTGTNDFDGRLSLAEPRPPHQGVRTRRSRQYPAFLHVARHALAHAGAVRSVEQSRVERRLHVVRFIPVSAIQFRPEIWPPISHVVSRKPASRRAHESRRGDRRKPNADRSPTALGSGSAGSDPQGCRRTRTARRGRTTLAISPYNAAFPRCSSTRAESRRRRSCASVERHVERARVHERNAVVRCVQVVELTPTEQYSAVRSRTSTRHPNRDGELPGWSADAAADVEDAVGTAEMPAARASATSRRAGSVVVVDRRELGDGDVLRVNSVPTDFVLDRIHQAWPPVVSRCQRIKVGHLAPPLTAICACHFGGPLSSGDTRRDEASQRLRRS